MGKIWNYIIVLLFLVVAGCESDADITIKPERKVIMYVFAEAGSECEIHLYRSISYEEKAAKMPLDEGARVYLTIDDDVKYSTTMDGKSTSVKFDGVEIKEGSRFVVLVEGGSSCWQYATSYVPVSPSAFLTGIEEVEREGKKYKECTIRLENDNIDQIEYYQLVVRDSWTGEVVEGVEYLDRLFEESKNGMIGEAKDRGLFTNNGQTGRFINLHCAVPEEGVMGDMVFDLYHLTYEHYCYLQSLSVLEEYMLLPVFSQNGVYSNVANGVGLVTGVGKQRLNGKE